MKEEIPVILDRTDDKIMRWRLKLRYDSIDETQKRYSSDNKEQPTEEDSATGSYKLLQ